jgi:hypothetical protein
MPPMAKISVLHRPARALAIAGLIAAAAGGAFAQTDPRFGPLDLADGFIDPWQLALTADGYLMENATAETSLRFSWATATTRELGSRTISTVVELVTQDASSSAGLLYGHQEGQDGIGTYYMFMLQPDDTVSVYFRHADGVDTLSSVRTEAVVDGPNELTISENGDQVSFLVNGQLVALIGGLDGMGAGSSGIVAWGIGAYLFSSYSVTTPAGVEADVPPTPTPAKAAGG